MLKEAFEKLKEMAGSRPSVAPSSFDDPVALQTEWEPLSVAAANFRTHRLVTLSPNRVEFRATLGSYLFALVFALIGAVAMVVMGVVVLSQPWDFWMLIPLAIGLIFGGVGVVTFRSAMNAMVFDRSRGFFWRGGEMPQNLGFAPAEDPDFARLDDIHALQLLEKPMDEGDTAYQLNLVLHDGRRVHIVSQGGGQKARMDFLRLSQFLEVPLWDAT